EIGASSKKHLNKSELISGIRLACDTEIKSDLTVELSNKIKDMTVLISGVEKEFKINPSVQKHYIVLEKPTLDDQRDDLMRIKDFLKEYLKIENIDIDLNVLRKIPKAFREDNYNITVTMFDNKIIDIEPKDTTNNNYGLAIDIGTTTIAVYLLSLYDGSQIDVISEVNNQRNYGADVISRINYTLENPDGLKKLNASIVSQLNNIVKNIAKRNNINIDNIYDTVIVGNTTMIHLLLGIDPENIAKAPYISGFTEAMEFNPKDIGFSFKSNISIMPGVSSYVGSDITAGILSSGMLESEKYSLLLDLGTNGEMAIGNKDEVITCSTAAGPAFEGANIKHGVGGILGAISKIDLSKEEKIETIGNQPPCGICGSGVLDAVSEMIKYSLIDETGRMFDEEDDDFEFEEYEYLTKDLVEIDGMKQYVLAKDSKGDVISFTQKDVREVQLAKAAINAGIQILVKEKNLDFNDLEYLYLGGGFGNYMNVQSSLQIGMIPLELDGKIKSIGNCAGSGAKMYLLSKEYRNLIIDKVNTSKYIELSNRKEFQD
ncbi:ASKHA domain-containing protein, partial [Intestinibacter bartlettii]|uniref:ASKHA domain-containing protein n=1 Tax=Intestinibacter bartlettii TaxID=261299 RepID=UPI003AB710B8